MGEPPLGSWAPIVVLAVPPVLAAMSGWVVFRLWDRANAPLRDRSRRGLYASLAFLTGWCSPFLGTLPLLDAIEPLGRPVGALRVYLFAHLLTFLAIPVLLALGITATTFCLGMGVRGSPRFPIAFGTVLAWGVLCVAAAMTFESWIPLA